ncbi:mucin-5AC [Mugil cephalus]|uniref:mucin-5AC n=1 Tax=Mugil cephalus TaxID=48193 RepID=UPI001FB69744|nr:mucin-5AC [Mugil cephalus]XP_047441905.1 mucin-5AC [Mugil cephalus]
MDSWTLQGDSYSFLRSAPRTFSLCHRDGTPNHVEIFDIINVPTQRSAISETTCLCDIFGDDCESSLLSSSPAVAAFVPSQREVDGTAAASPPVDDQNDSSSSYHTAPGSSEGEEGFEDSGERVYSPPLQSESSGRKLSDGKWLSSGRPEVTQDCRPNLEPTSKSPVPQLRTTSPSSQVPHTSERTPSPGHNSSCTLSPEGRLSSLSSSAEKRRSPSSPDSIQTRTETESRRITPVFKGTPNSVSRQSLTPSPSLEPRNCVSSCSAESANTQFLPEFGVTQDFPEPRANYLNQNCSPSAELTSGGVSQDFTESAFEFRASPLPSPSSAELLSQSRETLVSPELRNTSSSSPFPELRGRVSLPDLFSRGSTPDIEDSPHSAELISNHCTPDRDATATPASQDTSLSVEQDSTISTPAPRYTPPSPVVSITTSPELVESSVSPELRNTSRSPGLLSAASPAKPGTRTPSPDPSSKIQHNLTFSESRSPVSSPVGSSSLSPSPIEHRYTAPSPEIRITASSPEISRKEQLSEVETGSHFDSSSSRSPNSSPHITGISYSVVQPEDRHSPPFPELSHLSTPDPDRTHMSSEARSLTPSRDSTVSSIAESTGTPRDSPQILDPTSSVPEDSEITQPRYQTPSPQSNHHTPSPEPRYQTISPDKCQSPSPQHRSRGSSPVAAFPEQSYSPATLSAEYVPENPQLTPPVRNTPEIERVPSSVDITETQSPTHLGKESVSPSFELDKGEVVEVNSISPVVAVHSPVAASPVLPEEKLDSSLIQHTTEREETTKEEYIQDNSSVAISSEDNQAAFFQIKDNNPAIEVKTHSPNLIIPKNRSPNISPVQRATSNSPVQRLEDQEPQVTSYSLTSERISPPKPTCTPETPRGQLLPKVSRENRERFSEDMAHHTNRRRTPSPPLTRFTPVHIVAPEKPYRQWQNKRHSPSQVVASSPKGNLKKVVTNRESPNVAHVDNNSQAHWVRQGRQLEMEREMPLEQEREVGRQRQRDREVERERKREEQVPEKEEGWQRDASYRGEQVELSFSARNRKGPASRSAAPTSRETRQGLPTVHSYSESLLATRQLQQQQGLHRIASQQDTRGGSANRRLQPPAPHNKSSASGRVATSRPCQSSSSSMGSELDEADNEVKWFTDLAFRSLSSPEVDYLDMYNSSHRSSTNISQPSTQESPAGVNAAWLAYADFRGSASKLDHDDLLLQQTNAYYSDGLDPSRRYELGSFECVDVAVEREDTRKVRRGVPKRQIQLKRRNNADGTQDESSENSSPGLPVIESPSQESHSRTFLRQHSTPAAMQECYPSERSPEPIQQNARKSKLQKSASVDETCTKTKMATCLIKSVLSKKMQSVDKEPDERAGEEESPTSEENNPRTEKAVAPLKESPKPDALSSSRQSDYSLSSDSLPVRGEPSTKDEAKPRKCLGTRSNNRPSSSSSSRSVSFSQTDSEDADSVSKNATSLRPEIKSELKVPFDSKQPRMEVQHGKTHERKEGGDSANAAAGNAGAPSATGARSSQVRVTNRDQECENTEDHKQLQRNGHMPKPQEITLKAVEKKKASLNVCLTPEAENKPGASSPDMSVRGKEEKMEPNVYEKTEEEGYESNKVKAPIHKVRDVRRLVKNTYNLSFKAASAVMPSIVNEERVETFNEERKEEVIAREEREIKHEVRREERREERQEEFWMERKEERKEEVKDSKTVSPLPQSKGRPGPQTVQIEYKAVCLKEGKNKTSCNKSASENPGDKPQASSKPVREVNRETESLNSNTSNDTAGDTTVARHDVNITTETQRITTEIHTVQDSEDKPVVARKPPMLGSLPKVPSKEREVTTAVVLIRDGSNKTTKTLSTAQEEVPTTTQPPAASSSPGPSTPGSHSVSMLLKEKGYQADIGAVVGDNQNTTGGKGVPRKHVNCLEIPLQTITASDGSCIEAHRERTFSSSSTTSALSVGTDNMDALTKTREEEGVSNKTTGKDTQAGLTPARNMQQQTPPLTKQKDLGDFEAVKRIDPTFPPRSPAIRRFKPQPIEVKSLSKEPQKQEVPANSTGTNRPQAIEVKSIAKNAQKPVVPPKPSCKFKPADLGTLPNEAQRLSATTSATKSQGEERSQTIVVSSPTIYRKISNDSTSSYSRKVSVSAVSSLKPPTSKTTATTISGLSNQSTASSDTEVSNDRGQLPPASPQTSRHSQKPITLSTAPASSVTSPPSPVSAPKPNQIPGPASAEASQPSQPAVTGSDSQPQYPRTACPHEQAMPATSSNTRQPAAVSTTQVPRYTHQPYGRSLSSDRSRRTDDLRFYASDDPPSYDDRESFSPLMLPDLTPVRPNRFQPSNRPPPCSCTAGCPSHPGLTAAHHHRSPHNVTPPAPAHSPSQALPYPVAQPALRPHQCRPEPPPLNYQPGSPKSSPLGPGQAPTMYQPLHQPAPCPPHPSLTQACSADRPVQPPQHIDPRRPPVHRSPHQPPPGMAGAPYSDTGHSHSPGLPPMDPQYLCGPQSMGPSYGSEYGGDSSSLYSESSYGQTPRRVLLDPETGKYFYIEVPVQPLRKMLFDPETGQYVEVLIPQQAMSHSGLYPPSAAPYPPLHNSNMYAPAPQYMPYAAHPPPAHPQAQPQPPRYPEVSAAAAAMHPSGPGVSYRHPAGQGSKPDPQNHPPLDHSYLESMYYVPTGMNASPNPTPPDYYHKHPPNLPPTGGKRS